MPDQTNKVTDPELLKLLNQDIPNSSQADIPESNPDILSQLNEGSAPPPKDTTSPYGSFKDEAVGLAEVAGNWITQWAADAYAGWQGMSDITLGKGTDVASKDIANIKSNWAYQPKTPAGKRLQGSKALALANAPMEKIRQGANVDAEIVNKYLGPVWGGIVKGAFDPETIMTAAALIKGPKPTEVEQGLAKLRLKQGKTKAPSITDLENQFKSSLEFAGDSGVTIPKNVALEGLNKIKQTLIEGGADIQGKPAEVLNGPTTRTLDIIQRRINNAGNLTLQQANTIRKLIDKNAIPKERGNAVPYQLKAEWDNFIIDSLTDANKHTGAGDIALEATALARDAWTRKSKADIIQEAIRRAEDTAAPGAEAQSLITQFRSLARNKNFTKRWTPAEQEAIKAVAQGKGLDKLFRFGSQLSPRRIAGIGGTAFAYEAFGPHGAVAAAVGGEIARAVSDALTKYRATLADELVRRGPGVEIPSISKELKVTPPSKVQRSFEEYSSIIDENVLLLLQFVGLLFIAIGVLKD